VETEGDGYQQRKHEATIAGNLVQSSTLSKKHKNIHHTEHI